MTPSKAGTLKEGQEPMLEVKERACAQVCVLVHALVAELQWNRMQNSFDGKNYGNCLVFSWSASTH